MLCYIISETKKMKHLELVRELKRTHSDSRIL